MSFIFKSGCLKTPLVSNKYCVSVCGVCVCHVCVSVCVYIYDAARTTKEILENCPGQRDSNPVMFMSKLRRGFHRCDPTTEVSRGGGSAEACDTGVTGPYVNSDYLQCFEQTALPPPKKKQHNFTTLFTEFSESLVRACEPEASKIFVGLIIFSLTAWPGW